MPILTRSDIQQLDERIDKSVGSEPLLSFPRDIALMSLLRFFEDYCRLFALGRADFADGASLLKLGQDGMQFAIDWIHTYCGNPTRNDKLDLDFEAYGAAAQGHEAAIRYSMIWDLMAQLHRGAAIGELVENDLILLTYENPDAEVFDTCSHFFASPDAPDFQNDLEGVLARLNPADLLKSIDIHRHHSGRIKYMVPDHAFREIAEAQRTVLSSRWSERRWVCGNFARGSR